MAAAAVIFTARLRATVMSTIASALYFAVAAAAIVFATWLSAAIMSAVTRAFNLAMTAAAVVVAAIFVICICA